MNVFQRPPVQIYRQADAPEPPAELAEAGCALWQKVMQAHAIEGPLTEVLKLACLSADSAASMRKLIRLEGVTVTGSTGQLTANPLIAAEGAAQKRMVGFLKQLGVFGTDEPKRLGRPPNKPGRY
jgi:hypothetical protein